MSNRLLHQIALVALLVSCRDSQEIQHQTTFDPAVGERIPLETATRWTGILSKQRASVGRTETAPDYVISAESLDQLFDEPTATKGLAFHYATDENGQLHILTFPVSETEINWNSSTVVDALGDILIDPTAAHDLTATFENTHPGEIWYHYFGKDIFDEIRAMSGFSRLEIKQALNDEGKPQLLLYVWGDNASATSGRSSESFPMVYDASNPCPPCPKEEEDSISN